RTCCPFSSSSKTMSTSRASRGTAIEARSRRRASGLQPGDDVELTVSVGDSNSFTLVGFDDQNAQEQQQAGDDDHGDDNDDQGDDDDVTGASGPTGSDHGGSGSGGDDGGGSGGGDD